MKKTLMVLSIFFLIILAGCSSGEKVTVIKGPGEANSSLMVGFNEFCSGKVEGFSGDNLIVSQNTGKDIEIFLVKTASKETTKLLTAPFRNDYSFRISKNGKMFLYENYLVDIENKNSRLLPGINADKPVNIKGTPDYSFDGEGEIMLTNPNYYIKKYYKKINKGALGTLLEPAQVTYMKTGDIKDSSMIPAFNNIEVPEIDYIKNGELLPGRLKYIFIGRVDGEDNTPLYVFDLFQREFRLIDSNVKSYMVSPDSESVAYIRKGTGEKPENVLVTSDLDGKRLKELNSYEDISGMTWSSDGRWIAYSGGERNKRDIYIVKSDDTGLEQLTQGMNPSGVIAWSKKGGEVAFASETNGLDGKQTAYIIKLDLKTIETGESPDYDSTRNEMANKLREIIRMETNANK